MPTVLRPSWRNHAARRSHPARVVSNSLLTRRARPRSLLNSAQAAIIDRCTSNPAQCGVTTSIACLLIHKASDRHAVSVRRRSCLRAHRASSSGRFTAATLGAAFATARASLTTGSHTPQGIGLGPPLPLIYDTIRWPRSTPVVSMSGGARRRCGGSHVTALTRSRIARTCLPESRPWSECAEGTKRREAPRRRDRQRRHGHASRPARKPRNWKPILLRAPPLNSEAVAERRAQRG